MTLTRREVWIIVVALAVCGVTSFLAYDIGGGHGWHSGARYVIEHNCRSLDIIRETYTPQLGSESPAFTQAYEDVCTREMQVEISISH